MRLWIQAPRCCQNDDGMASGTTRQEPSTRGSVSFTSVSRSERGSPDGWPGGDRRRDDALAALFCGGGAAPERVHRCNAGLPGASFGKIRLAEISRIARLGGAGTGADARNSSPSFLGPAGHGGRGRGWPGGQPDRRKESRARNRAEQLAAGAETSELPGVVRVL